MQWFNQQQPEFSHEEWYIMKSETIDVHCFMSVGLNVICLFTARHPTWYMNSSYMLSVRAAPCMVTQQPVNIHGPQCLGLQDYSCHE